MSCTEKLSLNLFVAIFKKNIEHNSLDIAVISATQPPCENTENNEMANNFWIF